MKRYLLPLLLCAQWAHADVYMLDSDAVKAAPHARTAAHSVQQEIGKTPKRHGLPIGSYSIAATGSQGLIDAAGLKYFINTNITFSTTSSASGAMSEASYTHAVAASTLNGGTTMSTLNDAFDGYNTICISLNGTFGPCQTGNASFTIYNKNGPATSECNARQVVFSPQTIGGLSVQRKVFIPTDDTFGRWLNIVTNTSGAPITFNLITANNLGSDNNTVIVNDSSGNATPTINDTWVTTFQNFSGTTSSDPRLGHVLQGSGAATPVSGLSFANGNDNPWWAYTLTLAPGQTKIIMNFVTAQPSKAAAAAKAAALANLTSIGAKECMTAAEKQQVANFRAVPRVEVVPAPGPSMDRMGLLALLGLLCAGVGLVRMRVRQ